MVYNLGNVLQNFNNYYQDKTARFKNSMSQSGTTPPPTIEQPSEQTSPSSSGVSSATTTTNSTTTRTIISPPPQPALPPPPPIPPRYNIQHPSSNPPPPPFYDPIGDDIISNFRKISIESSTRFGNSPYGLSPAEFRQCGKQMIDYIADYLENVHNRRVVPSIEPGYLRELIPPSAPIKPESYDKVMKDFETYVMPGITHWQHPRFHAYFPAGNSFPSILANLLGDSLGAQGFSWAACPAMTELEMIVMDWFGRMMGLPNEFLPFTENGRGGGVIQSSASECNFVALLAARFEVMKQLRQRFPFVEEGLLMSKLIAYCSKEAHSSVEKAAMIAMVKLRILETDSKFRLRGDTLQAAITEDRHLGLIPFYVSATLGTTSVCSFDVLSEIGPVCTENDLWLHVDAAYAGSALICPEFRYLASGIEHAMSFNTNPNKWMLVNFDCSTMWVKDRFKLTQALVVDPLYLQHSWTDKAIDYRHWGIPLSRRFRALKLWFVIRMYGIEGLQTYIREHVRLAKKFETILRGDDRFEIIGDVVVGLVCFRLKASEEANQNLLTKLNASGRIHMVPASLNERFVIRFAVCHEHANDRDISIAYEIIRQTALTILHEEATAEPIIEEDYELERLEEKEYDQLKDESDSHSLPNKDTSIDSLNSYDPNTPPISANSVVSPFTASHSVPPPEVPFSEKRRGHTLAEKRSFLVRMVSDPKCYNPKIVRHLNLQNHKQMSQDLMRDRTMRQAIEKGVARTRYSGSGAPMFGLSRSDSQESRNLPGGIYDDETEYVSTVAPDPTGLQTPL